jgi:hypothetical protein
VLCIPLISDKRLDWLPVHRPATLFTARAYHITLYVLSASVVWLSIGPVMNMLSPRQMMNASFEPLHLINTYGAFGSITRERYEIVLEGTADARLTPGTEWREYGFKGKPGDLAQRPPQVAPYHLRLDWLMWFEAMAPAPQSDWLFNLFGALLRGDPETLHLLRTNPFPNAPRYIRARYYLYRFTTPDEHRSTGLWWHRELVSTFYGPVSLRGR